MDSDRATQDIQRICADRRARRELLWLRAMEKADEVTAAELERSEPELANERAELVSEYLAQGNILEDLKARRHWFGERFSARFEFHARRLAKGAPPFQRSNGDCSKTLIRPGDSGRGGP